MKQGFFYRRLILPILNLLRQGITPEKIALSIAFGIALGVFPVIGATTLLCAAAAIVLRLNLPAIQLVNYFVYPLQIALLCRSSALANSCSAFVTRCRFPSRRSFR